MHPFWDETVDFCNYLTYSVNKRLLKLLSKVLELDDEFLWNRVQSKVGPVGQGYFRQALYYATDADLQVRGKGMRMNGWVVTLLRGQGGRLQQARRLWDHDDAVLGAGVVVTDLGTRRAVVLRAVHARRAGDQHRRDARA